MHVTKKQLVEMMRRGATIEILCRRFEVDDKEQLFQAIRQVTPGRASEYEKALEKRERTLKKALAKEAEKAAQQEAEQMVQQQKLEQDNRDEELEETGQCENSEYENSDSVNEGLPLTEDVDGTFEEFNSLPVLYEQKNELSDQIKQSEEEHKHLMQERRAIERQLLNEKQKLEDILEEFRSSKARVLDLTQSYSELGVEMQRMSEDIAVNKELLEEIRNQIVAAEKISVYVYVNGSFDSDKELPDAEVSVEQELFTQLVSL